MGVEIDRVASDIAHRLPEMVHDGSLNNAAFIANVFRGALRHQLNRETLGRWVREAWVDWAMTQPNPKPSWLVPWEQLGETDREADRVIGERLLAKITS
jgi:transposase-like protein